MRKFMIGAALVLGVLVAFVARVFAFLFSDHDQLSITMISRNGFASAPA